MRLIGFLLLVGRMDHGPGRLGLLPSGPSQVSFVLVALAWRRWDLRSCFARI